MTGDKWEIMRDELSKLTVKQLKDIARKEGICLGNEAGCKEATVRRIVGQRRYWEEVCGRGEHE